MSPEYFELYMNNKLEKINKWYYRFDNNKSDIFSLGIIFLRMFKLLY